MNNSRDIQVHVIDNSNLIIDASPGSKILLIGDLDYSQMKSMEDSRKSYDLLMISTTSMESEVADLEHGFSIYLDPRLMAAFYLMLIRCNLDVDIPSNIQQIIDDFDVEQADVIAEGTKVPVDVTIKPLHDSSDARYTDLLLDDLRNFTNRLPGLSSNFNKRYLMTLWNQFVLFDRRAHSRYNTVDFHTGLPIKGRVVFDTVDRSYELIGAADEPFMKSYLKVEGRDSFYTNTLVDEYPSVVSKMQLRVLDNMAQPVCE